MNKRQQIEFQYLIEQLVHDMALMLMHDFGYDILSCVSITPNNKRYIISKTQQ